jgi:hypothetical protein
VFACDVPIAGFFLWTRAREGVLVQLPGFFSCFDLFVRERASVGPIYMHLARIKEEMDTASSFGEKRIGGAHS